MNEVVGLLRRQRMAVLLGFLLWFGSLAVGAVLGHGRADGLEVRPAQAGASLWWSVFSANAGVALLAFGGLLTMGVVTVLFSLVSGTLTGLGLGKALAVAGPATMALRVLPHALLELPAIALAVAAGLVPLVAAVRRLVGSSRPRPLVRDLLVDSVGLLGVALTLIFLAATIETWVSTL
ncbi:stage II sporulation protein M [Streptomyces pratensis]|uniref:stage II sporulation protein M n=1 Tax=Streptomyces pratensis TaxID=1169025 RepID=UPI0030171162